MGSRIGCVHGRFQPAHLEHWQYISSALELCDKLIVGVTQYDINKLVSCEKDPHRSVLINNPLTYSERVHMITLLFEDAGISAEKYSFTRFPIDQPELLGEFVCTDIICYTTLIDKWNVEKVNRLRINGYHVEVLWDKRTQNVIRSTNVRELAAKKDPSWRKMVSPCVAGYLDGLGFEERMQHLYLY